MHEDLMLVKACLRDIGHPVFTDNYYLALPWMLPSNQHFVVHMNYHFDRAMGKIKERGGIGGLIDQKYFATIILNKNGKYVDGSNLDHYQARSQLCHDKAIYDRIE